ncbi:MAG: 2-polyprenylphenol hydroxylase-like oxidoreductase [Clostridia bacterium]|jgi:dihydroorotate dehydrogenase electron transfer subunit|nr:2-polyprenylphenol hydroxylase-like oxidoreductase [Clostridia bacterium]
MDNEICKVIQNKELTKGKGIYEMVLQSEKIADAAMPGQFIHIRINAGYYPLLRRPISIHSVDKTKGTVSVIYHIKGQGTEELSRVKTDTAMDVMGPLGNGFPLLGNKKCAVVGGGIGTAPLLELAKNLSECDAYLGFRDCVYKIEAFEESCKSVHIATEDGSVGYKGYIIELLEQNIADYEVVYTCGPKVMMKCVVDICRKNKVECYVSIEERMGCGIGACLVCACKVQEENGEWHYKKACKDGPVFHAKEVVFDA